MDSGVHASLHRNCHHQVVYTKLNLKMEYPPLYERLNDTFKNYMANGRLVVHWVKLQKADAELINVIKFSKGSSYINLAKILNDLSTSNKTYWSVIKTFIADQYPTVIGQLQPNF